MNISSIPHMGIETATRCSCGHPVSICDGPRYAGKDYEALCHNCYDGTEDGSVRDHVRGFGETVELALWAWQDAHDEAHEVEWVLTDLFGELALQVSDEAARQGALAYPLAVAL